MNAIDLVNSGLVKIAQREEQEAAADAQRAAERVIAQSQRHAEFCAQVKALLPEAVHPFMAVEPYQPDENDWQEYVTLQVPTCVEIRCWFNRQRDDSWTVAIDPFRVPSVEFYGDGDIASQLDHGRAQGFSDLTIALGTAHNVQKAADERMVELAREQYDANEKKRERDEREAQRLELQRNMFSPFEYYILMYGTCHVDEDGNSDGGVEIFTATLLDDQPDANGYYHMANGGVIKPLMPISINRKVFQDADNMPFWCPQIDTEFGKIRVPPAERKAQPCGHARSAIVQASGGTAYCGECEKGANG